MWNEAESKELEEGAGEAGSVMNDSMNLANKANGSRRVQ